MMMKISVKQILLETDKEANDLLALLDAYSKDIMGGGEPLPDRVFNELIPALKNKKDKFILIAYDNETAVGLAICFEGFSTFYAKPLLNIHDFVITEPYRGLGISKLLLEAIDDYALKIGACKVTLEVLQGNNRAQKVYKAHGFAPYELDENMGNALFYHKIIAK